MNNLFAFHGSDHKVGTTQLAQCCADRLAEPERELSVLLVQCDGGRGSEYCSGLHESVERLRPYIARKLVDMEEIKRRAFCRDGLYVVGGIEDPENKELFTLDMAAHFLELAKDHFDIVIVDTGAQLEEGMALGALAVADRVYMVFNQRESSVQRYEWLSFLYAKLEFASERFILNRYDSKSLYETDYIAERLLIDRKKFFTVREERRDIISENERKSLIALKPSRGFVRDIDLLIKDMLCHAGIGNR